MSESLNIVLSPDNNYAQHAAVVMASICANIGVHKPHFWILDADLSDDNKSKLQDIKVPCKFEVSFLKIDKERFKNFPPWTYISKATWYRLCACSLLPDSVEKFLYLDCDIIVCKSLDELFSIDLDNFLIAGTIDVLWQRYSKRNGFDKNYPYFNAGVIMINAKLWREENIEEKIFNWLLEDESRLKLMDQTVLNKFLQDRYLRFHIKYNLQYNPPFLGDTCYTHKKYIQEYLEAYNSPTILHFMSIYKPWKPGLGQLSRRWELYYKYLKYTPWAMDEKTEIEYFKHCNKLKYKIAISDFCIKLWHKPTLIFRKLFWNRIKLEFKSKNK